MATFVELEQPLQVLTQSEQNPNEEIIMEYGVAGVMNRNVISIGSTKSLEDLEAMIVEHRISGFPVIDDGKLVGVVTTSDLVGQLCPAFDITKVSTNEADMGRMIVESVGNSDATTTVADVMTRDVITVGKDAELHDAADLMYENRIHRVFVTDGDAVVGVITPFDFVRLYATDRLKSGPATKTLDF